MMPMKPMGPPSDTAAPVAIDALKNATRWTRRTSTPARRGRIGVEAQQVQRPRQPGERREGEAHSGSAASSGA